MNYTLLSATTDQEFVTKSVQWLIEAIATAIADHGECIIGLSGGSTPKAVYTKLAEQAGIDWAQVSFFLVDDRLVPADHADSNQKLLADTLLAAGTITKDQCIVPDTSKGVANAVAQYTKALTTLFASSPPDVIVLGMGNDGHIASLFPPVPEAAFGQTLAVHTQTETFAIKDRISVSPLILLAAKKTLLLLKGSDKKAVFMECVQAELNPVRWPLHVPLGGGNVTVLVEE